MGAPWLPANVVYWHHGGADAAFPSRTTRQYIRQMMASAMERGHAVAIGEADWDTAAAEGWWHWDPDDDGANPHFVVLFRCAVSAAYSRWKTTADPAAVEIADELARDWTLPVADLVATAESLAVAKVPASPKPVGSCHGRAVP
jgi:hypothetical protein